MNKGLIFDVQRFSLNDGPGIRTTIFLKGCGLKCSWCHNPESIYLKKQLKHEPNKCKLCKKCVNENEGIKIVDNSLEIDFKKHNNSYYLVDTCKYGAYSIVGEEYSVEELMKIVKKDDNYYADSNGGVTLSGGEAMLQYEFIKELSIELKKQNYNVCLDISGNNNIEKIKDIEQNIDYFLMDFKLSDNSLMEKYVGKSIDIESILKIIPSNKIILRCPIIPGLNDNEEHFKNIKYYQEKYKIPKVDILPYHNMRKKQNFKRYNKYKEFEAFDKEIENKVLTYVKVNKIKNAYYKNKKVY